MQRQYTQISDASASIAIINSSHPRRCHDDGDSDRPLRCHVAGRHVSQDSTRHVKHFVVDSSYLMTLVKGTARSVHVAWSHFSIMSTESSANARLQHQMNVIIQNLVGQHCRVSVPTGVHQVVGIIVIGRPGARPQGHQCQLCPKSTYSA